MYIRSDFQHAPPPFQANISTYLNHLQQLTHSLGDTASVFNSLDVSLCARSVSSCTSVSALDFLCVVLCSAPSPTPHITQLCTVPSGCWMWCSFFWSWWWSKSLQTCLSQSQRSSKVFYFILFSINIPPISSNAQQFVKILDGKIPHSGHLCPSARERLVQPWRGSATPPTKLIN